LFYLSYSAHSTYSAQKSISTIAGYYRTYTGGPYSFYYFVGNEDGAASSSNNNFSTESFFHLS
jgi:hypothetical protein